MSTVSHRRLFLNKITAAFVLAVVTACASPLPEETFNEISHVEPKQVDFRELEFYALRAQSAYDTPKEIENDYPNMTRVHTIESKNVQYFIEKDGRKGSQTVSIRGTANKPNVLEDLRVALIPDQILGMRIHRGFREDAQAIFLDIQPHLDRSLPVQLTGHSLGAAIAAILAAYLDDAGYRIARVVTFGQPKFAEQPVANHVLAVSTRVANGPDVVPMVPPTTLFFKYSHFEEEIILKPGKDYVYLPAHEAERLSVGQFWRSMSDLSLKNHFIAAYLANIQYKIKNGVTQVALFDAETR